LQRIIYLKFCLVLSLIGCESDIRENVGSVATMESGLESQVSQDSRRNRSRRDTTSQEQKPPPEKDNFEKLCEGENQFLGQETAVTGDDLSQFCDDGKPSDLLLALKDSAYSGEDEVDVTVISDNFSDVDKKNSLMDQHLAYSYVVDQKMSKELGFKLDTALVAPVIYQADDEVTQASKEMESRDKKDLNGQNTVLASVVSDNRVYSSEKFQLELSKTVEQTYHPFSQDNDEIMIIKRLWLDRETTIGNKYKGFSGIMLMIADSEKTYVIGLEEFSVKIPKKGDLDKESLFRELSHGLIEETVKSLFNTLSH